MLNGATHQNQEITYFHDLYFFLRLSLWYVQLIFFPQNITSKITMQSTCKDCNYLQISNSSVQNSEQIFKANSVLTKALILLLLKSTINKQGTN